MSGEYSDQNAVFSRVEYLTALVEFGSNAQRYLDFALSSRASVEQLERLLATNAAVSMDSAHRALSVGIEKLAPFWVEEFASELAFMVDGGD